MYLRRRHFIIFAIIICLAFASIAMILAVLDYANVIEVSKYGITAYTEPSKEKLIAGITKTTRLKKLQVYATMDMTDPKGKSHTVMDSRMSDDRSGFRHNEEITVQNGRGKSTTQYIKTDGDICHYKITQKGITGGEKDWTTKKIPIKKLQGIYILAYGFDKLDMDLISVNEREDGITVYKVKCSEYYQKKMDEKFKNEKYDVKKLKATYWVNEENIVVRSKVSQHVIYDSTEGLFDVEYSHDAKLVSYNEDVEFKF